MQVNSKYSCSVNKGTVSKATGNILTPPVLWIDCRNGLVKEHHHFKSKASRVVLLVYMAPYSNKNLKDTLSFQILSGIVFTISAGRDRLFVLGAIGKSNC